jgi:hypothetical protein
MVDIDDSGQKAPICIWCEDGVPCEAAAERNAQPVRKIPQSVMIRVSKEDAGKYPPLPTEKPKRKKAKVLEPAIVAAAPGIAKKLQATVQDAINDLESEAVRPDADQWKRGAMTKNVSKDTLKGFIDIAVALTMFKQGVSVTKIAKEKGFPVWRFYQSAEWAKAKATLGTQKAVPRKATKSRTVARLHRAATNGNGIAPVYLSESAMDKLWEDCTIEDKAEMITGFMAKVHPA